MKLGDGNCLKLEHMNNLWSKKVFWLKVSRSGNHLVVKGICGDKADSGTIEQKLPQPFFGFSGRSMGSRGQRTLVRELRHNIRLGFLFVL